MSEWIEVGPLEQIPSQGAHVVATESGPVAVFRTLDNQLFAVADRCPHRAGPLSGGQVSGHQVTCPLHNWVIDLSTGKVLAPERGHTDCFAVKITNGRVMLQKPE